MVRLAACTAVLLSAASVHAQTLFAVTGESSFIQDLDANDGVDLIGGLPGTWSGAFEIDPEALSFVSNSQSQGGSLTRYSGIVLSNLTLQTGFGTIVVADSLIIGTLSLWDRRNFGAGQRLIGLDFEIDDDTFVSFDIVANADDSLYATLFNVGTPGANTYNGLPTFDSDGFFNALTSASLTVDGGLPILPGRGRYFGDALTLTKVPAPTGTALLGLAGLAAARRRR